MHDDYWLSKNAHSDPKDGRCALEWVSYLAGEQHSDSPVCVSPVLTRFCIRLNDRLDDTERQKLRPYLARTIGTRGDGMDAHRIQLCREFLLRRALPLYLDAAGREQAAAYLRSLPDVLTLEATLEAIRFARMEARDARSEAEARLTESVRAELTKRGWYAAADAFTFASAAASASASVASVASAADAFASTAAAFVAAAAAFVAAASAVDAFAAAPVVAVDVDVAVAVAAVPSLALRGELRRLVYEKALERAREFNEQLTPAAFDLLDRMLPTIALTLPAVPEEEAAAIAGAFVV